MPRVALINAPRAGHPSFEAETQLVIEPLADLGVQAELTPWYSPNDWSVYDLVVIRTPWDLYDHFDEFMAWLAAIESTVRVLNPPDVLRWNLDKRYLLELESRGVASVPTTIVEAGDTCVFPDGPFVVKPTTSGGARFTSLYEDGDLAAAEAHVKMLHGEGLGAIVQPYLDDFDENGERSLVFLGGRLSHAVRKGAVLRTGNADGTGRNPHPNPVPYAPSIEELALADAAISSTPTDDPLLYARVDLTIEHGVPTLMELEITEPLLFLDYDAQAPARLATAITARL